MHAIDFFFNYLCCYGYLAVCAFCFIHQMAVLYPGKLIVSPTLLRAIVLAWLFIFCHPIIVSVLPRGYYVFLFSLPVLPVIGCLLLLKGRTRFGIAGVLCLPAYYFFECARVIFAEVMDPLSLFR